MSLPSPSRSRKPTITSPTSSVRTPEDDLPEVVSSLWDAAKDAVLGAARVWRRVAKPRARADQLLVAAVDVLERAEYLLGEALEHAPVPTDTPK